MLLVTPYFINQLGVGLFGVWMLVNTIISSIGILNVGLGDATIRFVALYISKDDFKGVQGVIRATYSVYLGLSIIVSLIALLLGWLASSGYILDLTSDQKDIVAYIIPIAGMTLAVKFMEQVFLGVLKGQSLYPLASKISIVGKLLVIISNVILVYLKYSLLQIFVSTATISFIMVVVEAFLISKVFGKNVFFPKFDKFYLKQVFSFGIWTWALSVLGLLSVQIDKFIVIGLTDMQVFAFYSIGTMIFTQIHNFFSASTSWIFPIVTEKIAKNENVYSFYKKNQILVLIIAATSLTLFLLVEPYLLPLWLGNETYANSSDFIKLFVCLNFVMAGTILPYYFLNGSGHFRLNTYLNILTVVIRMALIPVGYYFFNTNGLVIGLIMASLAVVPFQMYQFHKRVLLDSDPLVAIKFILPSLLFILSSWFHSALISLLTLGIILVFVKMYLFPFKKETHGLQNLQEK